MGALELPLCSRLAADAFVRLGVVELFLLRVPAQFLSQAVADVAEMADGRRTVADFRWADRLLAAANAFDPIAFVIGRRIAVPFALAGLHLEDLGGIAHDLVAGDADRS